MICRHVLGSSKRKSSVLLQLLVQVAQLIIVLLLLLLLLFWLIVFCSIHCLGCCCFLAGTLRRQGKIKNEFKVRLLA